MTAGEPIVPGDLIRVVSSAHRIRNGGDEHAMAHDEQVEFFGSDCEEYNAKYVDPSVWINVAFSAKKKFWRFVGIVVARYSAVDPTYIAELREAGASWAHPPVIDIDDLCKNTSTIVLVTDVSMHPIREAHLRATDRDYHLKPGSFVIFDDLDPFIIDVFA